MDRETVDPRPEHVQQRTGCATVPARGAPQEGPHRIEPLPEIDRVLRDPGKIHDVPGRCLADHPGPSMRCALVDGTAPTVPLPIVAGRSAVSGAERGRVGEEEEGSGAR